VNPKAIRAYPRSTFDRAPVRGGSKLHVLIAEAIRDADPYASVEQFSRYRGDDIASLASEELDDERWRLRTARAFGVLTKWGRERLGKLDAEAERRRRRTVRR